MTREKITYTYLVHNVELVISYNVKREHFNNLNYPHLI